MIANLLRLKSRIHFFPIVLYIFPDAPQSLIYPSVCLPLERGPYAEKNEQQQHLHLQEQEKCNRLGVGGTIGEE